MNIVILQKKEKLLRAMKIVSISLALILSTAGLSSENKPKSLLSWHPTICLNMTVKDEAESIVASLESAKPWIDYWVIVDLESKDNTAELIRKALEGIPGELHVHSFVNLEYNRNQALELARGKGDYLLCLDADEELISTADFSINKDSYFFKINANYHAIRLINTQFDWHWMGIATPELFCPEVDLFGFIDTFSIKKPQQNLPFPHMHPYAYKQLLALQELLKRKPSSTRAYFLIAELYRNAQCPERAYPYYQKRAEAGGNEEEVFWSLYQMAEIQEMLGFPREEVVDSYNRAYNFCPSRIEPRYRLARYYREQGDLMQGYLIAKIALALSPSAYKIPANKWNQEWIYEYGLPLEYMLCSYYAELYEEALHMALQLLAIPHLPVAIRGIAENIFDTASLTE